MVVFRSKALHKLVFYRVVKHRVAHKTRQLQRQNIDHALNAQNAFLSRFSTMCHLQGFFHMFDSGVTGMLCIYR